MLRRVRGWIFVEYENVFVLVLAILLHSSGLVA